LGDGPARWSIVSAGHPPERERHEGIVIGQGRLEPAPVVGRMFAVEGAEAIRQTAKKIDARRPLGMRRQKAHEAKHRQRRPTWPELPRSLETALEHLARQTAMAVVSRELRGRAQGPQRA